VEQDIRSQTMTCSVVKTENVREGYKKFVFFFVTIEAIEITLFI